MNNEQCNNCRFWKAGSEPNTGDGTCRRHPPSVIHYEEEREEGVVYLRPYYIEQPTVIWEEWCGEWQQKPEGGPQDA